MRRLIKLLSPLILTMLFLSCVQSVEQDGSITFNAGEAVSRAVQFSRNRNEKDEKMELTEAEIQTINEALEFSAQLTLDIDNAHKNYHDSFEKSYVIDITKEKSDYEEEKVTFNNVPAGMKAVITGKITFQVSIKSKEALINLAEGFGKPIENFDDFDEEKFAEYFAEQFGFAFSYFGQTEINVKPGQNEVTLKMQLRDPSSNENGGDDESGIDVNGTIEPQLPQKLRIEMVESDEQLFLNKGTITFKLLDEADNDLVAAFGANGSAKWQYELRYGNTVISSPDYYSFAQGEISLTALPAVGTYQLYVQAEPIATGYTNCDTVSAMFDLELDTTYYTFDAANIVINDPPYSTATTEFTNFIKSKTTNSFIKFSGTTIGGYANVLKAVGTCLNSNSQYVFDLDFSDMTTSYVYESPKSIVDNSFQNCTKLRSIILPDDSIEIGNNAFNGCSNLEKIVFSSSLQNILGDKALQDCAKLTTVIIPKDAPLTLIGSMTFDGDVMLKTLSVPETFVALGDKALGSIETLILADETGTWYYTDDFDIWSTTVTSSPETLSSEFHTIVELSIPAECTTVSKQLLWAAQNTEYYFYCIK